MNSFCDELEALQRKHGMWLEAHWCNDGTAEMDIETAAGEAYAIGASTKDGVKRTHTKASSWSSWRD